MIANIRPPARVLLVEPPFYTVFGYERWHYPTTLTILGSYLKELGFEVSIFDADRPTKECRSLSRTEARNSYHLYKNAVLNKDGAIWEGVLNLIEEMKPDAVGFTSITPKIDSANIIAEKIKEIYGNSITTFLGGPHVDGMRAHYPDYEFGSYYDHVITHAPHVKQTIFNRKPDKKLIRDFDNYSATNLSSVLTSIGCPNKCTFCCHSFDRVFSYRDADNMEGELDEIRMLQTDNPAVYIMDDCIFSNTTHFNMVTQQLSDRQLPFTCGARIMALTPEKIERFVESGGKKLLVGIESGSQGILDKIEKNLAIEEIIKRTKWLNDANIPWSAFFVVGFPFENIDDLKATEDLINKIKPSFASINRFAPYPGTKLFEEYYLHDKIPFMELFQLNPQSVVKLDVHLEEYVDGMFDRFDRYNKNATS